MKLTTRQLRQIIKEEVQAAVRRRVLKEDSREMAVGAIETLSQTSNDLKTALDEFLEPGEIQAIWQAAIEKTKEITKQRQQ